MSSQGISKSLVLLFALLFPVTVFASRFVGDIDLSLLNPHIYIKESLEGDRTKLTMKYPDESIKIIQIIGINSNKAKGYFHIQSLQYLKDGILYTFQRKKNKLRQISIGSDKAKKIIDELKGFIK